MIDSKNPARESGYYKPFAFAVAAIAVCAALAMGTEALAPAAATHGTATYSVAGNGPTGYFPDQFVNQAKEIEPLPPTF
jgi:shikimate kinase